MPVGEYRLGTVTVTLDDPQGGQRWSFIFSDNGAKGEPQWYKVEKDGSRRDRPDRDAPHSSDLPDEVKTAGPAARTSCCSPCSTPATGC